jgi:hypothetical protein
MSSPLFNAKPYKDKYEEMAKKTEDNWVNRKLFISEMCKIVKKSNAQVNRDFKDKVQLNFEIKKIGKSNYIKLKEVNK